MNILKKRASEKGGKCLSRTHRPVAPSPQPSSLSSARTTRAQLPPKLVNSECNYYFLKRLNLETVGRPCLPPGGPRKLARRSPGKERRTAKINHRDQPDTLHVAARRAEPARGAGAGRAWVRRPRCRRTARARGARAPGLPSRAAPRPPRPAPPITTRLQTPARRAAPHTMGSAAGSQLPRPRPGPLRAAGEITLCCNLLLSREQLHLIAVNPLTRLWPTSGKPGIARICLSARLPAWGSGSGCVLVSGWKLTQSCPNLSERPGRRRWGTPRPALAAALGSCQNRKGMRGSKKRFPRKRPMRENFRFTSMV